MSVYSSIAMCKVDSLPVCSRQKCLPHFLNIGYRLVTSLRFKWMNPREKIGTPPATSRVPEQMTDVSLTAEMLSRSQPSSKFVGLPGSQAEASDGMTRDLGKVRSGPPCPVAVIWRFPPAPTSSHPPCMYSPVLSFLLPPHSPTSESALSR